ncbi:hypothetical protein [Spirochaeta dissipatitropha]
MTLSDQKNQIGSDLRNLSNQTGRAAGYSALASPVVPVLGKAAVVLGAVSFVTGDIANKMGH